MKLLPPPEIAAKLPNLYSQENKDPSRVKVPVKFFNPCGAGTWYATDYDPETRMCFGYCHISDGELGYFSLDELESLRLPFGLGIERDLHWNEETTLKTILDRGH